MLRPLFYIGSKREARAVPLVLALLALFATDVSAGEPDYQAMALNWARQSAAVAQQTVGPALRLEVSVGALDSRLRLAPCGHVEPFLPLGSRLWGKTRVGLRCVDGVTRWNVSVPATVKAFGPAWVVRSPILAGAAVGMTDVVETEVDWAEDSQPVLADAAAWNGLVAVRPLGTGQTLRQGMVRAPQVFQAGAQVRVIAQGPGFQVSAEAQALSAGVVGQPARVRMEGGRVTSGVVLDVRTVKIEL
ncbi:MAG: flagellar basal body P-ring formation protein FlgA [Burkholderiales bacterium]|nr:flagellar basal body P-ring formation protein FlgA [Burkholderiales bacterium]